MLLAYLVDTDRLTCAPPPDPASARSIGACAQHECEACGLRVTPVHTGCPVLLQATIVGISRDGKAISRRDVAQEIAHLQTPADDGAEVPSISREAAALAVKASADASQGSRAVYRIAATRDATSAKPPPMPHAPLASARLTLERTRIAASHRCMV